MLLSLIVNRYGENSWVLITISQSCTITDCISSFSCSIISLLLTYTFAINSISSNSSFIDSASFLLSSQNIYDVFSISHFFSSYSPALSLSVSPFSMSTIISIKLFSHELCVFSLDQFRKHE